MKKVLYISDFILEKNIGAYQVARSHLESLISIVGKEYVDVIALTGRNDYKDEEFKCIRGYANKFEKLMNFTQLNNPYINNKIIKEIVKQIRKEKYNIIFIDNSVYGKLTKAIRKEFYNIKIITFYHDVKRNLSKQWLKEYGVKYIPDYITNIYNEYLNVKFADINITLNKRESDIFEQYYKKKCDLQLPIYLEDKFDINKIKNNKEVDYKLRLLFVGAYYYPNIKGIKWFIKNVMPFLNSNIELYIVGRGLEDIKEELVVEIKNKSNEENVKVIGGVDDISEWYNYADIVIGPIFEGAGMKVKTAEALMYGKIYLATEESLIGYEDIEKYKCNTSEEFINKINYIYVNRNEYTKFNEEIRDIYKEKYSIESAYLKLKSIIE